LTGIKSKIVMAGLAVLALAACGSGLTPAQQAQQSQDAAADASMAAAGYAAASAADASQSAAAASMSAEPGDAAAPPDDYPTSPQPSTPQPSSASTPVDPAITACQGFRAMENFIVDQVSHEIAYLTAPSPADQEEMIKDAAKLAHWSYLVTNAISNGTSQATVQFPDDLGEAGLQLVAVAYYMDGDPDADPQAAESAIIAVGQDCASLGVTGS
jgi:hypothetical protein